jgi:large subunit ribosomal protein L10
MTRNEKALIIQDLLEQFKYHDCFYMIDATHLSVEAINTFRRNCQQAGVNYKVAKNTLLLRALHEASIASDNVYNSLQKEVLKGFTGVLFVNQSANIPAKLVKEFRKQVNIERPILKGAYVAGELYIGNDQLDQLSQLKSKQILIGEIIACLKTPIQQVISALQSGKKSVRWYYENPC